MKCFGTGIVVGQGLMGANGGGSADGWCIVKQELSGWSGGGRKNIRIGMQNARSVVCKGPKTINIINDHSLDTFVATEMWFNSKMPRTIPDDIAKSIL